MITSEASRHHGRATLEDIQSQLSPRLVQAIKKIKRERAQFLADRAAAAQETPTMPLAPPVRCTIRVTRSRMRLGHCLSGGDACEVDLYTSGGEKVNLVLLPVQVGI
jgi:hypothetical protein